MSVGIEQRRGLVGHHLLENRHDGLALGEPLAADAGEDPCCVGLVECDRPRRPAVGKGEPVEVFENPGVGRGWKPHDGQRAQMCPPEPRLEPAGQCLVDQNCIEIHRHLGKADAMAPGRDAGMQVRQGPLVREPKGFRHEPFDQLQHAVRPINEAPENVMAFDASMRAAALVEPSLSAGGLLGRRKEDECQVISALEMGALLLELRFALGVDQRRDRVWECALGIVLGHVPARFDEDRPT